MSLLFFLHVARIRLVITDVSGQAIGFIFKGQAFQKGFFSDCLTVRNQASAFAA
jgi:hypothetical protein